MRRLASANTADAGRMLHDPAGMARDESQGRSSRTGICRHISIGTSQLSYSFRGRWSGRTACVSHQIVQRRHARVQHRSHVARGIGHLSEPDHILTTAAPSYLGPAKTWLSVHAEASTPTNMLGKNWI